MTNDNLKGLVLGRRADRPIENPDLRPLWVVLLVAAAAVTLVVVL